MKLNKNSSAHIMRQFPEVLFSMDEEFNKNFTSYHPAHEKYRAEIPSSIYIELYFLLDLPTFAVAAINFALLQQHHRLCSGAQAKEGIRYKCWNYYNYYYRGEKLS